MAKVKIVKGYDLCGCDMEDDFLREEDLPELTKRYQCGECETLYEDRDEAKECCKD